MYLDEERIDKLLYEVRRQEIQAAHGKQELDFIELNQRAFSVLPDKSLVTVELDLQSVSMQPALIHTKLPDGDSKTAPVEAEELPESVTGLFGGFTEADYRYSFEDFETDAGIQPVVAIELIDPALPSVSNFVPIEGVKKILDSKRLVEGILNGNNFLNSIFMKPICLLDIAASVERLPLDSRNIELFNAIIQHYVKPFEVASSVESFMRIALEDEESDDSYIHFAHGALSIASRDIFGLLTPAEAAVLFKNADLKKIGKLTLGVFPTNGYEILYTGISAILDTNCFRGYEKATERV